MKTTILLSLLLALTSMPCFSNPIDIEKKTNLQQGRPRTNTSTVVADYQENIISIDVSMYLGNVIVSLEDSEGNIVLSETNYINGYGHFCVNTSSLSPASYFISIILEDAIEQNEVVTFVGEIEL